MLLKKVVLMVVLSLLFISCGDSTSSNSDEKAPELPSLEAIQPDLSYFINNNPQKAKQTANNFNSGKTIALSFSSISSFGQIYAGLFQSASQQGSNFDNGEWVWDYNYSYQNESVSIVLTSHESGNEFIWDMTWSYQGSEGSYDDYTVIEGRTAKDGSHGSWTFNALDPTGSDEVPFLTSTWERQSDSEIVIETEYYNESTLVGSFTYSQDGDNYSLGASDLEDDSETTVHWNTETETGYFETDGERKCWDSNFQDTACS